MWELEWVLYFGIVSVPVPVLVPHKCCLIRPYRLIKKYSSGVTSDKLFLEFFPITSFLTTLGCLFPSSASGSLLTLTGCSFICWFSGTAVLAVWTGALPRWGLTAGCIHGWGALVVFTWRKTRISNISLKFSHGVMKYAFPQSNLRRKQIDHFLPFPKVISFKGYLCKRLSCTTVVGRNDTSS